MMHRLIYLACLVAALGLTGCGGSDDGDGGEPGMEMPGANENGLTEIRVEQDGSGLWIRAESVMGYTATAMYDDGRSEDVTDQVEWSSSDEDLLRFDETPGRVRLLKNGSVTVTATLDGVSGTNSMCIYPRFSPSYRLGQVIPPVRWSTAYLPGGDQGSFDLSQEACNEDVSVFIFMLGTTWCGACSAYARRMSAEADAIRAAGGRIVFVELENSSYQPATNDEAQAHLTRLIGEETGVRVGDADSEPSKGYFAGPNGFIQAYPTVLVVRRSDMKVIADGSSGANGLDMVQVAQNPDIDWANPPPPPFNNACGDGDEEDSEPNDVAAEAAPLSEGTMTGGICTAEPDFFHIQARGAWTLSLDFSHATGDLDMEVWDVAAEEPLRVNGETIGSYSGDDGEVINHSGEAIVRVFGFRAASAPYTLTFTSR